MQYKVVTVLALSLLLSLAATRPVDGEVPTAADVRADSARGGALTTNSTDFTGSLIESSNPQLHGMEAEGAKNATYQAAYRSCMRRKGF